MGTTLELIQAYPLGTLEVSYAPGNCRALVMGIDVARSGSIRLSCDDETYFAEELTPVLFSFPDLTTPLPDGTVPAVSLIESFGYTVKEYDEESEEEEAVILTSDGFITADGFEGQGFELMPDGVLTVWNKAPEQINYDTHNAADWMRAHGFALPINGKPLVEGVDFIRKER